LTTPQTTLRFAIAAFDAWDGLHEALRQLSLEGVKGEAFNCLGLQCVFADTAAVAALPAAAVIEELHFPGNSQLISCTPGPVAQRLAQRLQAGATTLQVALSHWFIPRHAAHFEDAVERGRILLWVQLFDDESERCAYRSLLARSSNSVGVHDIVSD
jgi:hypothetical protein